MRHTYRITNAILSAVFIAYSVLPIYVIHDKNNNSKKDEHLQKLDSHDNTLDRRAYRLPGCEETDGDFHHHDAQGGDLIRVMKKCAIETSIYKLILPASFVIQVPNREIAVPVSHAEYPAINTYFLQHKVDGYLSNKTKHSPPLMS